MLCIPAHAISYPTFNMYIIYVCADMNSYLRVTSKTYDLRVMPVPFGVTIVITGNDIHYTLAIARFHKLNHWSKWIHYTLV